jgi:hypothetical protein
MSDPDPRVLLGELGKTRGLLARHRSFYEAFLEGDYVTLGRTTTSAIVLAELMVDFYTCVETLFVRISQFFENSLLPEIWHKDLLHKMTLQVEGIRRRVISDEVHDLLAELLRFRHFKRYYFEFDYDWDRLDYVQKKYEQVLPLFERDLDAFEEFLRQLL